MKTTSAFLLLLIAILSSCAPTQKEIDTVNSLTVDMRTVGIGRHLIDIPKQWEWSIDSSLTVDMNAFNSMVDETAEIHILSAETTRDKYRSTLLERTTRIATERMDDGKSMLLSSGAIELDADGHTPREATILRYADDSSGLGHRIELHLLLGCTYVLFKASAYKNVYAPVQARLTNLARQTYLVGEHPERAGPGFIFGPVIIRAENNNEFGTLIFSDPARLDLQFDVDFNAQEHDSLETIFDRADQFLPMFDVGTSTLRRGRRPIADMDGQEMLLSVLSKDDETGEKLHGILFAAQSSRHARFAGLAKPKMTLRMEALGTPVWLTEDQRKTRPLLGFSTLPLAAQRNLPDHYLKSVDTKSGQGSLTDYEAEQVWDAILNSIRPRPGAVPKPPQPEPPLQAHTDEEMQSNRRAMDSFLAGAAFVDPMKASPAPTVGETSADSRSIADILASKPTKP